MICVYVIINILDDKQYVGQAIDRDYRWYTHKKELRGYYHHSILLQRAWCKYGEENFIFVVLEVLDHLKDLSVTEQKAILKVREQYWIDILNPEYNIAKVAGSRLGVKQSDDARQKMRESHLGKSWHTENSRKLASERMKGNTYNNGRKQTPERIEARAALHRKPKSEDHKRKISEGNKGKTTSLETRAKQSLAAKNRKPASEATCKKLSDAAYRQWNDVDKKLKADLTWDDILPSLSGS